jgi:hypothetical protein
MMSQHTTYGDKMTEAEKPDDSPVALKRLSEILDLAHKLKADGRKSPDMCDAYQRAAERFHEAALLSREILRTQQLDLSKRIQLEIFCPYYFYEAERSLSSWHYEKRDTELARSHLSKAAEYAEEYINGMEAHLPTAEASFIARLSGCLKTAKFCRENDNLALRSIDARAAWDRGDFISALDEYRRMGQKFEGLIEQTKTLNDPSHYRITLGNYLSTFANASGALAMHIAKTHDIPAVLPHDVACSLIRYTMDAYRAGMAGANANPEWSQYRDSAQLCQRNVEDILKGNESGWAALYAELHDDADFVKIMARLDLPKLKRLERGEADVSVRHDTLLSREGLLKRITLALSTLKAYVESINGLRLFDANIVSESFFARFLGEMFDLSLVNLNATTSNQAAIDLGDKDSKRCFQITSDGSKKKVRKTIATFRQHGLDKEYEHLRIVIVGSRVGKYDGLQSTSSPVFDPESDVLGVTELVSGLSALDTNKLRPLVEIVESEMPAVRSAHATLLLENTQIVGGDGNVGPGGDARVKGPKGGNISIVGGTIRGGDGGEGGGKGGNAIIEGGNG